MPQIEIALILCQWFSFHVSLGCQQLDVSNAKHSQLNVVFTHSDYSNFLTEIVQG